MKVSLAIALIGETDETTRKDVLENVGGRYKLRINYCTLYQAL